MISAQAVLVLDADAADVEQARPAEGVAGVVAAVVGRPGQVLVPRELPPLVGLGVVVEEPVLAGDVAVVDGLVDGVVAVVGVEVDVLAPPRTPSRRRSCRNWLRSDPLDGCVGPWLFRVPPPSIL